MHSVDLEISLVPGVGDAYSASMRLQAPDATTASHPVSNVPVAIDQSMLRQSLSDPYAYGRMLSQMLFDEPRMREGWATAKAFAQGSSVKLRVRLRMPLDAPRLHGLCWEMLADPQSGASLALNENILLSRYLDATGLQPVRQPERANLRAIVAVASPGDLAEFELAPIDRIAEVERAATGLGDIPTTVLDGADGRPSCSLISLTAALRDGADILYLVCHGTMVDDNPVLWLEGDDGKSMRVAGHDLATSIERLGPEQRPLLIVLAACEGATGNGLDNTLRAVGPLLAAVGVGAVIAMQGLLPMATAARLLPTLFRELRRDSQIDRALAAARAALSPDEPWWIPALFLRLRDGMLWRAPQPPIAPAKPARIFLSYKRNTDLDEPLAMRLDAALRRLGHSVFIDQRLTVGLNWATTIEREIAASDAMVVLLSREAASSEMVLKEVEHARRCFEHSGKARLLPVRVAYSERLPYRLGMVLDQIQYALWRSPADDMALVAQLGEALAQVAALPSPQLDQVGLGRVDDLPTPLPHADPAFIESLSEPSGAVERESEFYIEREGDIQLRRQLTKAGGTMTTIRAPRQCGKSSLLYGGISQAGTRGQRSVLIDLQSRDRATFASLDSLLRSIAATIVSRLRLDLAEVERGWQGSLGPSDKLTYLMEDYVLPTVSGSLTLAIDEVDRMLSAPYRDSFFGLLRSWFNGRTVNPLWKKLNTVLVISTEPYLLIRDVSMSPFNVGLSIRLDDFDEAQVRDLNRRYREPLREEQIPALLEFLGGHPYLTHKALYTLVTTPELNWEEFTHLALGERSPLGDHVRRYYWMLRDQPDLRAALQTVIREGRCPDELAYERLVRAGLVTGVGPSRCAPRCRLYAEVLRG